MLIMSWSNIPTAEITVDFTAASIRVPENGGPALISFNVGGAFPDNFTSYFVFVTRDDSAEGRPAAC